MKHNELQYKLLQSLLSQPEMLPEVQTRISLEDFSNEHYRDIFEAIMDYGIDRNEFTESDFHQALINKKIKELPSDIELLIPTVEPPTVLADLLKRSSLIEKTKTLISEASQRMDGNAPDLIDAINELQSELSNVTIRLSGNEEKNIVEQIEDFAEYIQQPITERKGIPTMLPELDKYTGGWKPGQLITVAAKTGIGKSVFATNCTISALKVNKPVLFFSLEMSPDQLLTRMVANYSDLYLNDINPIKRINGVIDPRIKNSIGEALKFLKESDLVIDNTYEATIEYIKGKSKEVAEQKGELGLIVIDYIQLIKSTSRVNNRQEQISEISRSLKVLAKELNVPIMVVAQLNRGKGQNNGPEADDEMPSKDDIRESGAIAMDSDVVIIIHRKYRDEAPIKKAVIILDKNRDGVSDKMITVHSVLEKSLFKPLNPAQLNADAMNDLNGEVLSEEELISEVDEQVFGDGLDTFNEVSDDELLDLF